MTLAICATVGGLLILLGLVGCFLPGMPGPSLSYAGLLMLLPTSCVLGVGWMVLLGLFCVAVTLLDLFLPALTARRFGGTRWGAAGSLVGLLIGLLFLPPGGALFGAFGGAWLAEVAIGTEVRAALKPAFGALVGLVLGTVGQATASLAVGGYFVAALLGLS